MSQFKLLLVFLIITQFTWGQSKLLSPSAKVSILTCDSGEELYSAFGHSAIRVSDSINNIDLAFNYGTFDFSTPNFYLKFANGKLNYMLSASKYKYFLPNYFHENRTVIEQTLNLSQNDKQSIYDALLDNYRPSNRNYKYDFFFDNCATRIYAIIESNIKGSIRLKETAIDEQLTFREYLHTYLINSPWIEMGLDLLLGMPADKNASIKQSTYLPNFLMYALDNATLGESNTKLVLQKDVLLDFSDHPKSSPLAINPSLLSWFVLVIGIILSFVSLKYNFKLKWFDAILFLTTGFIGLFLCYMWFITDHQVPQDNLNVLWAVPFAITIPFLSDTNRLKSICLKYQFVSLLVFVLGWFILPQHFPMATLPLAILLLLRTTFIIKGK